MNGSLVAIEAKLRCEVWRDMAFSRMIALARSLDMECEDESVFSESEKIAETEKALANASTR